VRLFLEALMLISAAFAGAQSNTACQKGAPYSAADLVKIVKTVPNKRVINDALEARGINFQLSPGLEKELRGQGVSEELIGTLRKLSTTNHRSAGSGLDQEHSSATASNQRRVLSPRQLLTPERAPLVINDVEGLFLDNSKLQIGFTYQKLTEAPLTKIHVQGGGVLCDPGGIVLALCVSRAEDEMVNGKPPEHYIEPYPGKFGSDPRIVGS
jgi:hypothetical protein